MPVVTSNPVSLVPALDQLNNVKKTLSLFQLFAAGLADENDLCVNADVKAGAFASLEELACQALDDLAAAYAVINAANTAAYQAAR